MSPSRRSTRMFWLYMLQTPASEHPEVCDKYSNLPAGGMGHSPMERSGTDPECSGARTLGALDAAAAVRLPLRSFAP